MNAPTLQQLDAAVAAEQKFQSWLDASNAAYIYVEQTTATFSSDFRSSTKRPDFIVGIPTLGTIAVDVKAKSATNSKFFIDVEEQERIAQFEFAFGIPVWYVILRADTVMAYLMPNASIAGYPHINTNAGAAYAIPYDEFHRCNPAKMTFYGALYEATCLLK